MLNTEIFTHKTTIHEAFATLHDIRQQGKVHHPLLNVVFIAVCGILCGANNWVQIAAFGKAQEAWFAQFLHLPHGTPSHDVFGTVFRAIYTEYFSECFCHWLTLLKPNIGKHIAFDGKLPRGSKDGVLGKGAIDMVSAFATECGLTLAQRKVDEKSNEITAIPQLLDQLAQFMVLSETVITIDAIGCQTDIVTQIDELGADYVIALKGNQGHLHEDTIAMFTYFQKIKFKDVPHTHHRQVNGGHGRIEIREAWAFSPALYADYFRTLHKWSSIRSLIMIRSERRIGGKVQIEYRYYISSLVSSAKEQMHFIRAHWGIENTLHWVLDVAFREDDQRVRKGDSAANFVALRHLVLNLLRLDGSKGGIETKRLKCAWDTKFRMQMLAPILNC